MAVNRFFYTFTSYWQQLDTFEIFHWSCSANAYKQIVEQKHIGLNSNFKDVPGCILGTMPQPSLREAFFEVQSLTIYKMLQYAAKLLSSEQLKH